MPALFTFTGLKWRTRLSRSHNVKHHKLHKLDPCCTCCQVCYEERKICSPSSSLSTQDNCWNFILKIMYSEISGISRVSLALCTLCNYECKGLDMGSSVLHMCLPVSTTSTGSYHCFKQLSPLSPCPFEVSGSKQNLHTRLPIAEQFLWAYTWEQMYIEAIAFGRHASYVSHLLQKLASYFDSAPS